MLELLKFKKWLPKVSAVYNPGCILVNLSKIFGGIIPIYLKLTVCIPMFHKSFIYLIKKTKFKRNLYYKTLKFRQVNPFKTRNYMKIQDIGLFFQFQKKIPLDNCVFR